MRGRDHLLLVAGALSIGAFTFACSQSNKGAAASDDGGSTDSSVTMTTGSDASSPGSPDSAAIVADGGTTPSDASNTDDGGPTCITLATPQSCAAPVMTALPICNLSQTGCMDPVNVTQFAKNAVYYEVNSPLWSDEAAKTRAFVLPDGGTIHVKNCDPDASAADVTDCTSAMGILAGSGDTGKWEFPVGTVMIKNFMFDGKLVETRLFMHLDDATAGLIGNGTSWVGYNYAWNAEQTEATVLSGGRTPVSFNTGTRTVQWNYPAFNDCIGCHAQPVGTIGPSNAQMNREVDGGNQIDHFVALKLFDTTAPQKPYPAPMLEPYANAALGLTGPPADAGVEPEARSYLAANCGFCHRPDVNDQGFDLRYSLTFAETQLCGQIAENGIPGLATQPNLDFVPGDHADSALWIRMNIAVPASDVNETEDVGRMPPLASFVLDTQANDLIASWIDSVKGCPDAGP